MRTSRNPLLMALAALQLLTSHVRADQATLDPTDIKEITKRVADWQIKTFPQHLKYRAIASSMKELQKQKKADPSIKLSRFVRRSTTENWHDLDWHNAALYAGMYEWSQVAGDPGYTDWLTKIGNRNDWKLYKRPYHADDQAVGQVYLSLYQQTKDRKMIVPLQKRFDWILANPKTGSLEFKRGSDFYHRWGWCDALFMAPPVWARLAKVTGDEKYLNFMHQEYKVSYDYLWDKDEHLFFRDSNYFKKREANGKKIFWSRGNGWVFGGLALMIPDLPKDWEHLKFYLQTYKQMAEKLKTLQRRDGTWSMGLLGGEEGYPIKESSGSAFFIYGLAWGVNNGYLDRDEYFPIITKGWSALVKCVQPDGLLGYVQPVGAAPGDSFADKSEVYGVGAFLAAGAEVYKLSTKK